MYWFKRSWHLFLVAPSPSECLLAARVSSESSQIIQQVRPTCLHYLTDIISWNLLKLSQKRVFSPATMYQFVTLIRTDLQLFHACVILACRGHAIFRQKPYIAINPCIATAHRLLSAVCHMKSAFAPLRRSIKRLKNPRSRSFGDKQTAFMF